MKTIVLGYDDSDSARRALEMGRNRTSAVHTGTSTTERDVCLRPTTRGAGGASRCAVDVILRDGRTLRLRPPRREDADSLLQFFGSLSERSRYLRFHGFPLLGPRLVESCSSRTGSSGRSAGALTRRRRRSSHRDYVRLAIRRPRKPRSPSPTPTSAA